MHGVTGKPPETATDATSRFMLLLLVAMTGVAPISLYLLVPALPVLATTFGRDISIAQMTVSLYMVGIACSQIIMGPLSDRFGRRPVLLAGLGLMIAASLGCSFAETLPQLIVARFFQALGGATGMVVSRAIIRDLYPRERVGAMISLVIAVMMIAQMLSALFGGLLETALGWRSIFYVITAAALLVAIAVAVALPESRRARDAGLAVHHPDAGDGRQCVRDVQLGGGRHQRPPGSRRHRIGRDGIPADGARRAAFAIRRLARRPFCQRAAAQHRRRDAIARLR